MTPTRSHPMVVALRPTAEKLDRLLQASAALHQHLCPRQVLGVRMGLAAGEALSLEVPRQDKRLLVFVETDGCAADGVSAATGCWIGRRTLRIMDFGKVAATFVDSETATAVRIHPHPDSRLRALALVPDAKSRWHAMRDGYQRLPVEQLLILQPVELRLDLEALISRAGIRANCDRCGEEIINEREVLRAGQTLCRGCAGAAYYVVCDTAGIGLYAPAELSHEPSLAAGVLENGRDEHA